MIVAAALLAAALLAPSSVLAATPDVECTDDSAEALRLDFDNGAFGFYALPAERPRGIVVFAHGHSNSAWKWRKNLADTARDLGVIAVAMDYRGQTFPGGDITKDSYGWRVREGAEDSIAAAQLFERKCLAAKREKSNNGKGKGKGKGKGIRRAKAGKPDDRPVVIYGVSMGGNTSGLAVAAQPKRADGRPLWDYWFDIEGVDNALETYFEGRMVAGPPLYNTTGQTAVNEFREENGGKTFEEDPDAYADLATVNHAEDVGAAGLKGVVMVHGVDDGTVPFNQTPEMFSVLVSQDVPTDVFAVGRTAAGQENGNTMEDTFTLTKNIPGYEERFAGHGGENNPNQPVIGVGFERLAKLIDEGRAPRCFHAWVYDAGSYSSDPEQQTLPDC